MAYEIKKSFVARTEYHGLPGDEGTVTLPDGCRSVLFVFDRMEDAQRFNLSCEPVMSFDKIPREKGIRMDRRGNVTNPGETPR